MTQNNLRSPASGRLKDGLLSRDRARRAQRADLAKADSQPPRRNDLLPRLQLVDRPLDALKAPLRNVRQLDPAHVREIVNSILALGFSKPPIIGPDGEIIDGIATIEAARQLGLSSVPCVVLEHLTPPERKLLRIALNRLGEKGAWNLDALKIEVEELIVLEMPIEVSGFDKSELDVIVLGDEDAIEEGCLAPAADAQAVARLGDVFELGPHRVVCGDARDPAVLARLMGDDLAQMLFTDMPYNVLIAGNVTKGGHREFAMASGEMDEAEFAAFNAAWIEGGLAHLVDGGILATFIDWRGLGSVTAAALEAGLVQINLVVWTKTNAGMGSLYRSQHELLPMFKNGTARSVNNVALGRKGRHRTNVWTYPGASSLGSDARKGLQHHPTVKPVAMLVDGLHDLTNRGDIVLDPFLGSGSMMMAAEKAGRVCRGVELDPLYVDVIVRRYEQVTGKQAVLVTTGESFRELERSRSAEGARTAPTALLPAPAGQRAANIDPAPDASPPALGVAAPVSARKRPFRIAGRRDDTSV